MVVLVLAILASAAGFAGAVTGCTALLALFTPKSRTGVVTCFLVAVLAIAIGTVAVCNSTAFFRYSAGGPVVGFMIWPTAGGVTVGAIAAVFAMSPIGRRLVANDFGG